MDQSNGNRIRAKKLISLRARKLLAKVFYQGFYVYRRDSQLTKKLNQAAAYFFVRRYLGKGVKALKQHTRRARSAAAVADNHSYAVAARYMRPWKEQTNRILRAKKFRSRTLAETQFKVFKSLFEYGQQEKVWRGMIEKGLQAYSQRLQAEALDSLKHNVTARKVRRETLAEIDAYYCRSLQSKVVVALKDYRVREQRRREIFQHMRDLLLENSLKSCFAMLAKNKEHQ